ncbi:MAG: hypothetical protein E6K48_08415 [Gammaproteobacteria bacterium]|nr:MAG: hypothetical protein E6K48_08415 [Gammaproteobacteria bacterium]
MNAGLEGSAASPGSELAAARPPLRFVSAASLFDGHDAAINMIRRLLQARGAEVVHLGHNRSVADIVRAAIDEDADAIAVSSYQGGHNEYFAYMVDMLRERGCEHIRVVVGGGGTIAPHEIEALERRGRRGAPAPVRAAAAQRARPCLHRPHHLGARRGSRRRSPGGGGAAHPGALAPPLSRDRHHRHRRGRQVEPDGRAARASGAAVPAGPDRGGGDGPDAPQERRRPPRGPHPHQQPRLRERVHALARHAAGAPGDRGGAQGRDRALPGRRLRPGAGRDRGHRTVGHRDRGSRRPVALCDDERVRRGESAREDRHARLRRLHRAEQGREARRRGQPARRA